MRLIYIAAYVIQIFSKDRIKNGVCDEYLFVVESQKPQNDTSRPNKTRDRKQICVGGVTIGGDNRNSGWINERKRGKAR